MRRAVAPRVEGPVPVPGVLGTEPGPGGGERAFRGWKDQTCSGSVTYRRLVVRLHGAAAEARLSGDPGGAALWNQMQPLSAVGGRCPTFPRM